ncbi:related to estradiol 17 beta-dehydrogenase [Ramularia collo-cygni]|uniref:Related to estradiol 17 beta-dehydrogenase n=1 Tax=Ramularia collo-cygni TaxID=112498 RepID=A0A2D3UUS4_9PEZI|nr:related to estradiol 17 beta-dehydrogenase [Ramularia collo-cygni]CZT15777.1 related to estradiol 17 beta-dehydrogenase [Ramularia collo-cygni]
MSPSKRTILITGCSDGGMGAALAAEFHRSGLHVIATARKISSMSSLASLDGIEILPLDITSKDSIQNILSKVDKLDILLNNAGAAFNMPISDVSIDEAKDLFDINVWGHLAITQAFLPLLRKSPKAMIVNHTSIGASLIIPFQAVYNASKAAMSTFTQTLRIELQPFDIAVVELKTGGVKTNVIKNNRTKGASLPESSIYAPAKDAAEDLASGQWAEEHLNMKPEDWARAVTVELLKGNPPPVISKGDSVWTAWIGNFIPYGWLDATTKKLTGLAKVEELIRRA